MGPPRCIFAAPIFRRILTTTFSQGTREKYLLRIGGSRLTEAGAAGVLPAAGARPARELWFVDLSSSCVPPVR